MKPGIARLQPFCNYKIIVAIHLQPEKYSLCTFAIEKIGCKPFVTRKKSFAMHLQLKNRGCNKKKTQLQPICKLKNLVGKTLASRKKHSCNPLVTQKSLLQIICK
jgi:hypothetical protein